ncbi:sigma-70 family RNA polymerase sigma factor [Nocardioides sp. dk4132]|uniref:sigma-70 family RNA polymerase sigma factor n=1 Tax=unclassified Nocardioides TaxID=2615069 RepID=UPI001294C23B|nr:MULTISPECIES: sigma-70 family RNA polymerase sigma factor [unclassified Nocardioides]MQW75415.1 sigma-70 family RNA polymerase sigma factor [Nocardioides sp. dk4132]QGA08339.1 sigma-70 family RNA polymerase sigma factor [Nocardioides sp. dk884]
MSPEHVEITEPATIAPSPVALPTQVRDGDRGKTRQQRSELTRDLLDRAAAATDPTTRAALLEEVVLVNRGVAEAVAARYRNRGIAQDDLVQVAYEGLTKAVKRFDPELRNDLLTYAVPTIRGEVQRYFRDQGWTVRPPRRIQELQWRVNRCLDNLGHELGREPSDEEVMSRLDLDATEYREVVEAFGCFQPTSLDNPVSVDGATTLGELIADEDHARRASEARVVLAPVVRQLSERDRRILYLRFFEDRTQEQIGNELGVTQMQVSRLLSRILRRLREQVEDTTT